MSEVNRVPARIAESIRAKAIAMYQAGASSIAVAKELGIAPQSVRNWAQKAGCLRRQPYPHEYPSEIKELAIRLYETGKSIENVAASISINTETVREWVARASKSRKPSETIAMRLSHLREEVIKAYLDGKPATTIAKELGISSSAVYTWLDEAGMKRRKTIESRRLQKGYAVDHAAF